MNKVNIIIIGAMREGYTGLPNNYKTWNNIKQADYFDIIELIQTLQTMDNYDISVKCIDPMYNQNIKDTDYDIHYINTYYKLGDTSYCSESGHNIFIEFSNMLDEHYVTKVKDNDNQSNEIVKYNDYIISWVSCGCCWNEGFPKDLLLSLIINGIYTPTDIENDESYMRAIKFNESINSSLFIPYLRGLYQILGSLHWRGNKENCEYEKVLYKLIKRIMDEENNPKIKMSEEIRNDLKKFCNMEIRWNYLSRNTRDYMHKYVYGDLIT
jgi:hypothetical protein